MHKRLSLVIPILMAAMGMTAAAQIAPNWDTSGNSQLSGTYYFRHVFWVVGYESGDLGEGVSVYGTITFNGGQYTTNAQVLDTSVGTSPSTPQNFPGNYYISASGLGYMDNEYSPGDSIYGLVSRGIFIGSSTENQYGYNDLFIAVPVGSPTPTLSSLNGTYTIMGVDSPSLSAIDARDYQFTFSANGAGKLSAVSPATGYVAANGGQPTSQSVGSVSYLASNGAFELEFGGSLSDSNLFAGNHYLYMSPDGSFVFGGSPNGWDMFVGVKTASGQQNFSGLYYQAGLDLFVGDLVDGNSTPDSYYGSLVPGSSSFLYHQRLNDVFNGPYDYTSDDPLTFASNGSATDPFNLQYYVFSSGGTYRVGVGNSPILGISVAIQEPPFSGSGVYVNPSGIENSGNYALFTAGISPGAVILINGSGFSTGNFSHSGASLPASLGGTKVMIDGIAAPLIYVTPSLIAAQVPFEVANASVPVVGIQVVTSSASSNTVTLFESEDCSSTPCVGATQPGAYSVDGSGLGAGAVYHAATFQPVTSSSPAQPGETLAVYINGLGPVSPSVPDGTPASGTTLSDTVFPISADFLDPSTFDYFPATVSFAGLAPTYAGLYQMDLVVPANDGNGNAIPSGNLYLEFQGLDPTSTYVESYTSQVVVAVAGSGVTASNQPASAAALRARRPPHPAAKHRSLYNHRTGRVMPRN